MVRVCGRLLATGALGAALLSGAAEIPPAGPQAQPETQPAAAVEAPKQRVKPSEPPDLTLLFTDQVVGYINPCG
jgi:hypothetical protein